VWLSATPRNANDIEPGLTLIELFGGHKELRRANHFLLFPNFDSFQRRPISDSRTRLHFDKNDHALVQHDEVQLSPTATVVAFDELVTLLFQEELGNPFTLLT
jgi:hypothetical protein